MLFLRPYGMTVPKGQSTLKINQILNIAHNALSISPLLLLVGKAGVSSIVGKEILLSVSSYFLIKSKVSNT
jgi:hypothetical protein